MEISRESFTPKVGTIKDRNGRDLVNAEEIKRRWKEYMEEWYKKDLNESDNYNGVVSHPEPDILECEVKAVIGNTTRTNLDGILAELFKIRKDDAVKVLHTIC